MMIQEGLQRAIGGFFLAGILCAAPAAPAGAQENAECLECHSDITLTTRRDGREVSLYFNEKAFATSAHAKEKCAGCHADLAGAEFPHPERLERVNCGKCHAEEQTQFDGSLHGRALARGDQLAPRCETCHGGHHAIPPVSDPRSGVSPMRIPYLCGSCHQEGAPVQAQREIHQSNILENYSESIHGEGLLKKGLTVSATCNSCHTSHNILPHTDPRSSIARQNVAGTCTRCHALIETVHRKIVKGELWEKQPHAIPACVDCHQPHKARKVFYEQGMADNDCLRCHADEKIRAGDGRSLHVKPEEVRGSMHTRIACAQCHTGVTPSRVRACETVIRKVDCSVCHTSQVEQFQTSIHGMLAKANDPNAPVCVECHGTHGILGKGDTKSATFPVNVPDLCGRCHREGQKAAARYHGKEKTPVSSYVESIHGKGLLKSGLTVTAMCTSCHTAHREQPAADSTSSVNRNRIANTCSQCHHGIYQQFTASIHSPAVSGRPQKDLPVCNECHTAHKIKRTDESGFRLDLMDKCGRCHEKIAETYFDTYHGKVTRLGYGKTAKCFDCHGAHDILPTSNPKSHLSRNNVVETCRKCHAGATRRFAGYLTHATHHDPQKYPWLFATFWGMTFLLIGTFSVSGIHTLLWLPKSLQMRRQHPPIPADSPEKQVRRFKRLHSLLHIVMVVSFITLALTGMALKFSYTGWARFLSQVFGGFETAGYVHRVAAVLMAGLFITHLADLVRAKKAEYPSWWAMLFGPDSMLLNRRDLAEFRATFRWYLGKGERPRYGRWTYWEKFDYFAVFWGIAIIGSSGLLLWFSEFFTRFLPGWLINVATIIHSDEALLAVGFIFTIHFFNTHFRPDKFPMDISIFTGRVPLEELKRDRPAEYEALVASGELEKVLVDPLPPSVTKAIRAFGWIALALGLSLVVGIIYVFLFSYR